MEKSFLFKETTARSGAPILRSKNFDPATMAATHTFKTTTKERWHCHNFPNTSQEGHGENHPQSQKQSLL